jgi:hypothetical protein
MSMRRLIGRLEESSGSPYKDLSQRNLLIKHLDKIAEKVDASMKFKGTIATLTVDGPREAKDAIDRMKAAGLWDVGLISKKMDLLKAANGMGGGGPIDFVFDLDLLDDSVDEAVDEEDDDEDYWPQNAFKVALDIFKKSNGDWDEAKALLKASGRNIKVMIDALEDEGAWANAAAFASLRKSSVSGKAKAAFKAISDRSDKVTDRALDLKLMKDLEQ